MALAMLFPFVVAIAAATCPAGYSESPSGKCMMLTQTATAYRGCADLCGAGSSLACLSSAGDADYAITLVDNSSNGSSDVFFGLFQPTEDADSEPAGDWICSSGETTAYFNWRTGEPNDGYRDCIPSEENCAALRPGVNGTWHDSSCLSKARCLCELGASASPAFAAFVEELQELEQRVSAWQASAARHTRTHAPRHRHAARRSSVVASTGRF